MTHRRCRSPASTERSPARSKRGREDHHLCDGRRGCVGRRRAIAAADERRGARRPAGTTQSFTTVSPPISYLQLIFHDGPVTGKCEGGSCCLAHDKVAATMKKAGPLADGPNLRVSGGFRPANRADASPVSEVHANEADLSMSSRDARRKCLGARCGRKRDGARQIRGPKAEGGHTYQIGKGDVMWVPAGMPHWFPEIREALGYLLVKVWY